MEHVYEDAAKSLKAILKRHSEFFTDNRKLKNIVGDYIYDADVKIALRFLVDNGFLQELRATDDKTKLIKIAEKSINQITKKVACDRETACVSVNFWYKVIKAGQNDLIVSETGSIKPATKSTKHTNPTISASAGKTSTSTHISHTSPIKHRTSMIATTSSTTTATAPQIVTPQRSKGKWRVYLIIALLVFGGWYLYSAGSKETLLEDKTNTVQETIDEQETKSSEEQKPISEGNAYDKVKVDSMMIDYCRDVAQAVNTGDANILGQYIEENSPLAAAQDKLVNNLFGKSVREEFIAGGGKSYYDADKDEIIAQRYEKYKILNASGEVKYVDNFWVYTMAPYAPYKLRTITAGKNPYKHYTAAVINSEYVDLHVGSSKDSDVVSHIQSGDSVNVFKNKTVSNGDGDWIWIKHPEYGYGWVKSDGLSYSVTNATQHTPIGVKVVAPAVPTEKIVKNNTQKTKPAQGQGMQENAKEAARRRREENLRRIQESY